MSILFPRHRVHTYYVASVHFFPMAFRRRPPSAKPRPHRRHLMKVGELDCSARVLRSNTGCLVFLYIYNIIASGVSIVGCNLPVSVTDYTKSCTTIKNVVHSIAIYMKNKNVLFSSIVCRGLLLFQSPHW